MQEKGTRSVKDLKKAFAEYVDEMPEKKASMLSHILLALDVFVLLLIILLLTKNLGEYIITLFGVPILLFLAVISPGFRLRKLEKPTWLLFADAVCAVGALLLLVEADKVYSGDGDMIYAVLYVVSAFILSRFICRSKWLYYIMFPVSFIFALELAFRYIPQYPALAVVLGAILGLSVVLCFHQHRFYFGIGRDERIRELMDAGGWGNRDAMKDLFTEDEMKDMFFVREKKERKAKE